MNTSFENITEMPSEAVFAMSERDWLRVCWEASSETVCSRRSHVVRTERGFWDVACGDRKDLIALQNHGQIIARLHRLHLIRMLPELRGIRLIPPDGLLQNVPYAQMPEKIWRTCAWKLSVDEETGRTTTILSVRNGIWQVRCDSEHAWAALHHPECTLRMIGWLSVNYRPLPEARQISMQLGMI